MQASVTANGSLVQPEDAPRLRLDVLDALMTAKGITTIAGQAQAFGMNASHWSEIRGGHIGTVTMRKAGQIAKAAGTTLDVLWEL